MWPLCDGRRSDTRERSESVDSDVAFPVDGYTRGDMSPRLKGVEVDASPVPTQPPPEAVQAVPPMEDLPPSVDQAR